MTSESLTAMLGKPVADAHLIIAKNSVLGLDEGQIADLLGVTVSEVREVQEEELYKEVRVLIAAKYNEQTINTALTWDAIEAQALKNIEKRVSMETNLETNLKIATLANRAQRRHVNEKNQPLDAGAIGKKVSLTLTRRVRGRLSQQGVADAREVTEQISIHNGTMENLTFADVDQHLNVTQRVRTPRNLSFRTSDSPGFDPVRLEDLDKLMDESMKR